MSTGENDTAPVSTTGSVPGDNPIRRPEDDTLGREGVARSFARQVLALDAGEGVVVGVLGPWGSGKTSFINLARDELKKADVPVLDFNPWMFSGAQQLVDSFFIELAAELRVGPGLNEIAEDIDAYGEIFSGAVWLPVVGPWIERARSVTKAAAQLLKRRKDGVRRRRAKLAAALAAVGKPIVVVVDDIDRLSTSEIRDIFKLVRLTASFPNLIYVVAFDRARVEKALKDEGVPGRDYLEKILQVSVDLPAIPHHVLTREITSAIDKALATIEQPGSFDEQTWPDIFFEIIRPLVRNMRDVRRYAATIHGTVAGLSGRIALGDVLALEAIRVFLPDVFGRLHGAIAALTTPSSLGAGRHHDAERLKSQIDALINEAGSHGEVVRAAIERLFPAALWHISNIHVGSESKGLWLRTRRVAHEEIFRLYLERVVGSRLQAFAQAEEAWALMTAPEAFEAYLKSIDPGRLRDIVESLEAFEDQPDVGRIVPGVIVLLNLLPEVPEQQRGMLDLGGKFVITRVVYRLVRSLRTPDAIEAAVREILPQLRSLSAKFELISQVGYREGRGHKLVSEDAAAEFESAWRQDVRAASVHELEKETNLLSILVFTKKGRRDAEPDLEIPDVPTLTVAILKNAYGEATSQTLGTRSVRRHPRLAWDALVEIYGSEETLKARIEGLAAKRPAGADDLMELAQKYLTGWRPNNFLGDE